MKKRFRCIFFAVLIAAVLCGCGAMRGNNGTNNGDMDILPDVSPMILPDMDEGVVTDHDGIIGNGGQGADNGTQTGMNPSPSPEADNGSMGGQTGGQSGGQSGTSPSASPKP